MTFTVNRDANGNCAVSYSEDGASITLQGTPHSFTDAYASVLAAAQAERSLAIAAAGEPAQEDEAAPDNARPFKCPGCGATFTEPTVCQNQHPPIEAQPTEAVLAGVPAPSSGDESPAPPAAEPPQAEVPPPPPAAAEDTTPVWPA